MLLYRWLDRPALRIGSVVLDSLLYADARPFAPLARTTFLLEGVRSSSVSGGCVLAGVLGVVGWLVVRRR